MSRSAAAASGTAAAASPLMRLQAAMLRAVIRLLRAIGPVRASNLGGLLARGVGPWLPVSRIAHRNLELAMPELSAAERRRIVHGMWDNLGRTAGELPHLGSLREDTPSGPGWIGEGLELVRSHARQGGSRIFVSGHIGNWEMLPAAAARCGITVAAFYRASTNPLVDDLVARLRQQALGADVPMFRKGARGARLALAHLRRGGSLALLVDQKMNDGIETRFFGRPTMTAPAAAALALRLGCPIILAHVQRIGPARLRVVVEPAFSIAPSGDTQQDVATITQAITDQIEAWIRQHPESWLWLHRRWPKELYRQAPAGAPDTARLLAREHVAQHAAPR